MKEYKYRGFNEPIIVDDDGNATYRGHEIEKYYHGYKTVGVGSGFSYNQLAKSHYIKEMNRIDEAIRQKKYRESHKEEFENLETVEESLEYFFDMIGGWIYVLFEGIDRKDKKRKAKNKNTLQKCRLWQSKSRVYKIMWRMQPHKKLLCFK